MQISQFSMPDRQYTVVYIGCATGMGVCTYRVKLVVLDIVDRRCVVLFVTCEFALLLFLVLLSPSLPLLIPLFHRLLGRYD